jgi:hypothetical protein
MFSTGSGCWNPDCRGTHYWNMSIPTPFSAPSHCTAGGPCGAYGRGGARAPCAAAMPTAAPQYARNAAPAAAPTQPMCCGAPERGRACARGAAARAFAWAGRRAAGVDPSPGTLPSASRSARRPCRAVCASKSRCLTAGRAQPGPCAICALRHARRPARPPPCCGWRRRRATRAAPPPPSTWQGCQKSRPPWGLGWGARAWWDGGGQRAGPGRARGGRPSGLFGGLGIIDAWQWREACVVEIHGGLEPGLLGHEGFTRTRRSRHCCLTAAQYGVRVLHHLAAQDGVGDDAPQVDEELEGLDGRAAARPQDCGTHGPVGGQAQALVVEEGRLVVPGGWRWGSARRAGTRHVGLVRTLPICTGGHAHQLQGAFAPRRRPLACGGVICRIA